MWKFQTFSGRDLYSTKTPRFDYLAELTDKAPHELLEDLALPREWQPLLAEHCRQQRIEFLSSPFDRRAVDELDALQVAAFKVASFELVDLPLIEYIGARRRPVSPARRAPRSRGPRRERIFSSRICPIARPPSATARTSPGSRRAWGRRRAATTRGSRRVRSSSASGPATSCSSSGRSQASITSSTTSRPTTSRS